MLTQVESVGQPKKEEYWQKGIEKCVEETRKKGTLTTLKGHKGSKQKYKVLKKYSCLNIYPGEKNLSNYL